ncbi:MAG: hypothetical protein ACR9NN_06795 [Nostochopsis sp.]
MKSDQIKDKRSPLLLYNFAAIQQRTAALVEITLLVSETEEIQLKF